MKKNRHRHNFTSDGGQCTICGYTVVELMDMKKKKEKKYIPMAKYIDVKPYYHDNESIETIEQREGHGFWGNSTTGYITDEESKRMR